mgnify:CR=1 FL=1
MNYLFHLGRAPELSCLEIVSFLQRTEKPYKILKITKKFMLLELENFDAKEAIKCLGGTIKISSDIQDAEKYITSHISSNKIEYGINVLESSQTSLNGLTALIKTIAKRERIKAMHKHAQEREIPPSKSKNLDFELTLCKNNVYRVVAVSDPKSYGDRDEVRPYFDPLQVISVRLAKILINFAQPKKNDTLLDPFVGLGTIIQEASLMGINAMGTDNDLNIVKKSQANISWARNKFHFNTNPGVKILDVARLSKELKNIGAIATEPYLGPYLKKMPWEGEAREIAAKVSRIYESFLIQASKLLKQGSKMAIVVPTFKTRNNKIIRIGFQSMLEKHKFNIYQPLNNTLVPIDYKLHNGKILRKIYILEKL